MQWEEPVAGTWTETVQYNTTQSTSHIITTTQPYHHVSTLLFIITCIIHATPIIMCIMYIYYSYAILKHIVKRGVLNFIQLQ